MTEAQVAGAIAQPKAPYILEAREATVITRVKIESRWRCK